MLNDPRVQPLIDKLPAPLPRWLRWMRKPDAKWVRIATGISFIIGSFLVTGVAATRLLSIDAATRQQSRMVQPRAYAAMAVEWLS